VSKFGPITTDRKIRHFGVVDLEWVPGEVLALPEATELKIDGIVDPLVINLPPRKVRTEPLQLRLAGYYDQVEEEDADGELLMNERYEHFRTIEELIDFLLVREHRGMWFFAHAGGLFDMEFVLDELLKQIKEELSGSKSRVVYDAEGNKTTEEIVCTKGQTTWTIRASFSGSSAILIHVTRGKHTWHFVDSYWLFRDKLAKIGESIGIKKKDEEKRQTPEETRLYYAETPLSVLIPYNKVDCEILWKAVHEFEKELFALGGQLQQTIASTAMNLFRRKYLKRTIQTSEVANQIAVQSYFASRVEVFQRFVEKFWIYDINSSFPYSMTFPLPGDLVGMSTTLPSTVSDECIYIADATVEVPEMAVPPLPFRTGEDSRVFFPTGKWRSWFTSTDLNLAMRENVIIHKVHECYEFEPFYDFKSYAVDIYKLRVESENPFRKLLLKYLLNSLYGKAAESLLKQEMLINPPEEELDREKLMLLQPGIWLREKTVPIAHRHVVVSAIITALSRRHLYDYAKMCEAQEKPMMYCDSITGDRTVVLKDSKGWICIDPVEEVWEKGKISAYGKEKESCYLGEGWTALAKDSKGVTGWFPLKRLIRHKTSKTLYLMSAKRGQVHVTEDHSLVVDNEEIKPVDFIARNLQFEVLTAPKPVVLDCIDLYEYLKDFSRMSEGSVSHGGEVENHFELDESGEWIYLSNYRNERRYFKRFYKRGTEDFHRLLRLLGAFISEGSSSVRGYTTETRDMFSLSQKREQWLTDLRGDLEALTQNVELLGPKWSQGSGVYYLRSGAGLLPCLFGYLCGIHGSAGRKLPSFLYALSEDDFSVFWGKIMEGDGTIDVCGEADRYTTISQQLAAGVSYLFSQHGLDHLINYRAEKGSYLLRTRKGKERKQRVLHVEKSTVTGYVYDLEVEGAHTFVDGVGRVLLHNTDSVATRATLPTSTDLGKLKLEKDIEWAEFVAPKIYLGEGRELKNDGSWKDVKLAKAKGFSLGKFPKPIEALRRIIDGEQVGVQSMVRMRELYRASDPEHAETAPYEKLVIKALTQRMLSKRFQYPDGHTRAWTVEELMSGDFQRHGFDFGDEFMRTLDTTTRSMLAAAG
jgi:predicted secreted protein